MHSVKSYITALISLTLIVQVGSMLVSGTKFHKLYKAITGVLILFLVISPLLGLIHKDVSINIDSPKIDETQNINHIEAAFTKNLCEVIRKDIYSTFGIETHVDVSTDMKTLTIMITGSFEDVSANSVKEYVKSTYCTGQDEVSITYE